MVVTDPRLTQALAGATVNEQLFDSGVRHALFLEQLKAGEASRIVRFLNSSVWPDLVEDLEARLKKGGSKLGTRRYREMITAMRGTVRGGIRSAGKQLRTSLGKIALSESEFQRRALTAAVPPLTVSFRAPALKVLAAAIDEQPMQGQLLKQWFGGLSQSTQRALTRAINTGIVNGESIARIKQRIRGTKALGFADGALATTNRHAETIARTAVTHATATARESTYAENDDVVKGVRYVATLDARTTDVCASLDGRVFDIHEGERPPLHMRCRSTTVPVIKSWKELGLKSPPASTRASLNGQVPAKQTYNTWLKKQPKAVQERALGKGRAELFRKGQLKIDKFVNPSGKSLTLEQLRNLEELGDAFPVIPKPNQSTLPQLKSFVDRLEKEPLKLIDKADPDYEPLQRLNRMLNNVKQGKPFSKDSQKWFNTWDTERKQWLQSRAATYNPAKPLKGAKAPKTTKISTSKPVEKVGSVFTDEGQVAQVVDTPTGTEIRFKTKEAWVRGMPVEHREAISSWKGGSTNIRRFERLGEEAWASVKRLTERFQAAIRSSPRHKGTVYRGLREAPFELGDDVVVGTEFELNASSSFTKSRRVADGFGSRYTLIVEDSKFGTDITKVGNRFAGEKEVVHLKGTRFRVKAVRRPTATRFGTEIVLEEIKAAPGVSSKIKTTKFDLESGVKALKKRKGYADSTIDLQLASGEVQEALIGALGEAHPIIEPLVKEASRFGVKLKKVAVGEVSGKAIAKTVVTQSGEVNIVFNARYFGGKSLSFVEGVLQREASKGWLAGKNIDYVVRHEIAHALEAMMKSVESTVKIGIDVGKRRSVWDSLFAELKGVKPLQPSRVSGYAQENSSEYIAEMIAKAIGNPTTDFSEEVAEVFFFVYEQHSLPVPTWALGILETAAV